MSIGQVVGGAAYESVETVKLKAAANRSPGDVVRISTGTTNGVCADLTIADNTNVYTVAVVLESASTNDVYLAARKGTVKVTVPSGNYTAGNGLDILDGAVRDSTAAAEAPTGVSTLNDFAVIVTGGTSVTEVVATLYGSAITAQT